jgi:hypothetical protein
MTKMAVLGLSYIVEQQQRLIHGFFAQKRYTRGNSWQITAKTDKFTASMYS